MANFLSAEWFQELNETLASAEPVPFESGASTVRVVIEFSDAPSGVPRAISFFVGPDGARAEPLDDVAADANVQLSFADGAALTGGDIDSASALRDGRIKVRGDINAIVPLLNWLQRAHPKVN